MFYRLRTDFRLSIITLLGACAIFGITPFAIYRFLSGNIAAGIVDLAILASIVVTVAYAWLSGKTRWAGFCLAIFACGGATIVATMQGDVGIFWLYPAFITSFFLTSPRAAVFANGLAIVFLAVHNVAFDSLQQMWSFVTTSLVVSCCAYIFALRTESQRVQLEKLATHDPLTGAKNRRAMEKELQIAVETAQRADVRYALVILDLDHFKPVNDEYGHSMGDLVLVSCARIIADNTRQTDHLFRFGGEEFVLIMPGITLDGLRPVIANLKRKLAAELKSPGGPVTASFGAALLEAGEDWNGWLARADDALYRAKDAGRDCAVIDGDAGEPIR